MELVNNLLTGFGVAFSVTNLALCFIGVFLGTLVGVLPGIGSVATLALLLPLTFGLDATGALIMLAGIYYGAQYGGSTTAILVNIPGEAASVITALDGHQMARQGMAGRALAIAAIGSFSAGCLSTLVVAALGIPLTSVALAFGPADYFSLMVMGLVLAVVLSRGSLVKAFCMILLGLMLSTVGIDMNSGSPRATLGYFELSEGISFTIVAMGLFGFGEILANLAVPSEARNILGSSLRGVWPTRGDLARSAGPIARGSVMGSLLGVLPGGGAVIASFASYALEKRLSRHPERFGKGEIAGVAAPESANNAAAQTSFIPLLTLGLPGNAIMALMVGAMTIHGIVPGPHVVINQPDLFWGLIASMWIGNAMLLFINLPLLPIWVMLLRIPYRLLYPAIMMFCCIGVYSINGSVFDVILALGFGVLGFLLVRLDFDRTPLLLGFVLGPPIEEYMQRAMVLSRGDPLVFVREPISAVLLICTLTAIMVTLLPVARRGRQAVHSD